MPLPFPGCPAFMVIMQALQQFVAKPLREVAESCECDHRLAGEVATAERLIVIMQTSLMAVTGGEPN